MGSTCSNAQRNCRSFCWKLSNSLNTQNKVSKVFWVHDKREVSHHSWRTFGKMIFSQRARTVTKGRQKQEENIVQCIKDKKKTIKNLSSYLRGVLCVCVCACRALERTLVAFHKSPPTSAGLPNVCVR